VISLQLSDLEKESDKAEFQRRLFGLFYEELLMPIFEVKGYKVQKKEDGALFKPMLYKDNKCTRYAADYLLEKDKESYLVEAKCYPRYNSSPKEVAHLLKSYFDNFDFRENKPKGETEKGAKSLVYWFNPNFFDEEVYWDKDKQHKTQNRIIMWWKSGICEFKLNNGLNFQVFSIYDEITIMIKKSDDAHKKVFLDALNNYNDYSNELFNALGGENNKVKP